MARPPTFTAAQKTKALELFHERGATAAAEATGCHRTQIYRWLRDDVAQRPEKTAEQIQAEDAYQTSLRQSIRRRLLEKVDNLLDRFDEPHFDYRGKDVVRVQWDSATSGDIRAYATSIGILIDKYRLEMGEHTQRTDAFTSVDMELQRALDEFRRQSTSPHS